MEKTDSSSREIHPYTRKMLRRERWIKILFCSSAVSVFCFLSLLILYLSFHGIFQKETVQTSVLPDYQAEFSWPEAEMDPDFPRQWSVWVSRTVSLQRLRADDLFLILSGKEKNWARLSGQNLRLKPLLTERQAGFLRRLSERRTGTPWHKSSNIVITKAETIISELDRGRGNFALRPADWEPPSLLKTIKKVYLADRQVFLKKELRTESWVEPPYYADEYPTIPLGRARELISVPAGSPLIMLYDYNWILGQPFQTPDPSYEPVQLRYDDYELISWDFFLTPPEKNGTIGGISTVLLSTLIVVLLSILISAPIGIAVAVYLVEYSKQGRLAQGINITIQTLSGIPSIIFGLFGNLLFVQLFGFGVSLLSGVATLTIMLLPTLILTAKEALSSVPRSYFEGSLALGVPKWYTILHISISSAMPGILAGILLAIGRAIGETAALIFTLGTGYQATLSKIPQLLQEWPEIWQRFWTSPSILQFLNIFSEYPLLDLQASLRTVSLHLYWMTVNGISIQKGYATAFVLILVILGLNLLTRYTLRNFSKQNYYEID